MRKVAVVQAVVWSIILRIHLRSQILRKHDLETAEMRCANARFLWNLTEKLRAESTGESLTLLDARCMVGLLSLESCCGRPKIRNSVLRRLRERKLEDIQLNMLVIVFSRWVMLWEKSMVMVCCSNIDMTLPLAIRISPAIDTFKRSLKTHYFCFPPA